MTCAALTLGVTFLFLWDDRLELRERDPLDWLLERLRVDECFELLEDCLLCLLPERWDRLLVLEVDRWGIALAEILLGFRWATPG